MVIILIFINIVIAAEEIVCKKVIPSLKYKFKRLYKVGHPTRSSGMLRIHHVNSLAEGINLVALAQQGRAGDYDNQTSKKKITAPPWYDINKNLFWSAWKALKGMSKKEAKK